MAALIGTNSQHSAGKPQLYSITSGNGKSLQATRRRHAYIRAARAEYLAELAGENSARSNMFVERVLADKTPKAMITREPRM